MNNVCDLYKAGWKLFRPEAYIVNLVEEGETQDEDTVIEPDIVCPT